MQVTGTNGFLYDLDLPRQEIFDGERYEYSDNTYSNLATASWSNEPVPEPSDKQPQIVVVRTLEPDRLGKSKKPI